MGSMKLPPPKRDTWTVEVPLPPSNNNLFPTSGTGHRYKSPEYKAWIEATEREFARLFVATRFPVEIWIKVTGKGVSQRRDVNNFDKGPVDQLKAAGVIPDDCLKYVDRVDAWYEPDDGEPRVVVTVCEPGAET